MKRQRPLTNDCTARTAVFQSGFTIIELLVSMAMISILLALIVPAVQSARESNRKVQCLSNVRQLVLATQNFESAHHRFPSYLGRKASNAPDQPRKNLSIQAQLLPYLDQQMLYDRIDSREDGSGLDSDPPGSEFNGDLLRAPVPVFSCPTDSLSRGGNSYRACMGTTPGVHTTMPETSVDAAQLGAFVRFNGLPIGSFRDGLSQTVLFSERLVGDKDESRLTPSRDVANMRNVPPGDWNFKYPSDVIDGCRLVTHDQVRHWSHTGFTWLLGDYTQTLYNHVLPPNSHLPDCGYGFLTYGGFQGAMTARSLHAGGVNVGFGDGSARLVSDSIATSVWRALGSIRGKEVVGD